MKKDEGKNNSRLFLRKLFTFSEAEEEKACEENIDRYPIVNFSVLPTKLL